MEYDSNDSLDYSPTCRINQVKQNDRTKMDENSQHYYKSMSFVDMANQENGKCVDNEIECFKNEIRFMILSEKFESFETQHIDRIIEILTKAVKKAYENSHKKKVNDLLTNLSSILDSMSK